MHSNLIIAINKSDKFSLSPMAWQLLLFAICYETLIGGGANNYSQKSSSRFSGAGVDVSVGN